VQTERVVAVVTVVVTVEGHWLFGPEDFILVIALIATLQMPGYYLGYATTVSLQVPSNSSVALPCDAVK
jgi:hypothetical protein